MKKWLCFLLAFGLMVPQAWAADDDEDDEEEEEAPKKKAAPPKKASKSSGTSRMGLAVSFSGFNGNNNGRTSAISFIYDLGSGLELGLGLGLKRIQHAEIDGETEDPTQTLTIVGSLSYSLGTGLLEYGIGVDAGVIMEPGEEGGNTIEGFPHFYTKVELVKNLSLKLSAGVNVYKPADRTSEYSMIIDLKTQGSVIFYFL
jgi:hypothetical protein